MIKIPILLLNVLIHTIIISHSYLELYVIKLQLFSYQQKVDDGKLDSITSRYIVFGKKLLCRKQHSFRCFSSVHLADMLSFGNKRTIQQLHYFDEVIKVITLVISQL